MTTRLHRSLKGRRRSRSCTTLVVRTTVLLLLFVVVAHHNLRAVTAGRGFLSARSTISAAHKFWWHENSRAPQIERLLRSIPAFSKETTHTSSNHHDEASPSLFSFLQQTEEASVKAPKKKQQHPQRQQKEDDLEETTRTTTTGRGFNLPKLPNLPLPPRPSFNVNVDPKFFIGITPETMVSKTTAAQQQRPPKRKKMDLQEGMFEALEELRTMRREMEEMRKELAKLKQLQMGTEEAEPTAVAVVDEEQTRAALAQRRRAYEKLAKEVERWAEEILFPSTSNSNSNSNSNSGEVDDNDDWTEVQCHKMLRNKFNPDGRTRAYLKWMKDSRGPHDITRQQKASDKISDGTSDKISDGTGKPSKKKTTSSSVDDQEWPCIRMYSTIDAPVDEVSLYLSQADLLTDYNALVDDHKDLEEITPHSKICWGRTPQVLFVKPRDFVTYCHHRWRRDGTQVVVNQACEGYQTLQANAHALRGATFIGPDPSGDPNKTYIAMVAHASPGADVPTWACKAAIQSLAPMEPYRLFFKINQGVKKRQAELQASSRRLREAELVASSPSETGGAEARITRRPAGLAQLGYACFWPKGGGEKEMSGALSKSVSSSSAGTEEQQTTMQQLDNDYSGDDAPSHQDTEAPRQEFLEVEQ